MTWQWAVSRCPVPPSGAAVVHSVSVDVVGVLGVEWVAVVVSWQQVDGTRCDAGYRWERGFKGGGCGWCLVNVGGGGEGGEEEGRGRESGG